MANQHKLRVDPLFEDLIRNMQKKYMRQGLEVSIPNITKIVAVEFGKIPPQKRRWEIKVRRCKIVKA
jgi:hypothetical protein